MTILRVVAIATAVMILTLPGAPARACDSNYPWLCKPVPSIDPPDAAAASDKNDAKPVKPGSRRAGAATRSTKRTEAKSKAAKVARAAEGNRKRVAGKSAARRWALRAQRAKAAAARLAIGDAHENLSRQAADTLSKEAPRSTPNPATPATPRLGGASGPTTGFAAVWAERGTGPIDPHEPPAPAAAAPTEGGAAVAEAPPAPAAPSVPVASQDELNELDLAARDPTQPADTGWLRTLFLAFGGILALGSALRLFL
jgi:hypothetical protein